jgi:hypothetical protein
MIVLPEHWDSPTDREDAALRLTAVKDLVQRETLELGILRSLYRRVRPRAGASDVSADLAETMGKAAYVTACVVGEAKVERANLRRWITVFDKKAERSALEGAD